MNFENRLATSQIGEFHRDTPVETSRAQERLVQRFGPIGGGEDNNAFVGLESIHLAEQLVEGLLALVVAAVDSRVARFTDGVDLVDEHDAGGFFLSLLEQIPHPRGAHAHEHFHELRSRDREKRHLGLAGHRLGQEGFAGPGGTDQEGALRNCSPDLLVLSRIVEELHDLLQRFLGLVGSGDIGEGFPRLGLHVNFGLARTEGHGVAHAAQLAGHPVGHQLPNSDEQRQRKNPVQQRNQRRILLGYHLAEFDAGVVQPVHQAGIVHLTGVIDDLLAAGIQGRIPYLRFVYLNRPHGSGFDLGKKVPIIGLYDAAFHHRGENEGIEHQYDQQDYAIVIKKRLFGVFLNFHEILLDARTGHSALGRAFRCRSSAASYLKSI